MCEAAMRDSSNNPLQPKGPLSHPNKTSKCKSWSAWVVSTETYVPLLNAILESNTCNTKKLDQNVRAEEIVDDLEDENTIRIMDGHLRLVYLILKKIREKFGEKRLNSMVIELVDIDPNVTAYHRSFFSSSLIRQGKVVLINQDITKLSITPNVLLYLNFCGISKAREDVAQMFRVIPSFQKVFISFSVTRKAKTQISTNLNTFNAALRGKGQHLIKVQSDRKDFVTYYISDPSAPIATK
eukprot:TRINITY_DN3238_c0_g1_i2.p1 TRINITY_DN3238_c0_g1~~TRINITY_DN3238_c0_g1_i2.p1  ORF type:complete len:240 (-),score=66.07 TRINITY_DN3238_c0_g1_i2:222-941(-)